jgi:hypothetical protein
MTQIKRLSFQAIKLDGGTQARVELDSATIDDYAEVIRGGTCLPLPIVFKDGETHYLADGFHRYHASVKAGLEDFQCEVREGTRLEAIKYALKANNGHGLRRTNADKRNAVHLAMKEFSSESNRGIAEMCEVSPGLVDSIRSQLPTIGTCPPAVRSGRDGKAYKVRHRQASLGKLTLKGSPANLTLAEAFATDKWKKASANLKEPENFKEDHLYQNKALFRAMTKEQKRQFFTWICSEYPYLKPKEPSGWQAGPDAIRSAIETLSEPDRQKLFGWIVWKFRPKELKGASSWKASGAIVDAEDLATHQTA